MPTEIKPKYSANTNITITLTDLSSSAARTTGRESLVVDNSSTRYRDVLLSGKITVGATPTVDTAIDIWVYSNKNDTPAYASPLDGTDSAVSFNSAYQRDSCLKLIHTLMVDTTANASYEFTGIPVAPYFGGTMPKYWGLFVVHNTASALNSTAGNFEMSFVGIVDEIVTT